MSIRLAIAAIFKNEAPYILEWIAFHKFVGIDHFFIADNNSDDGTTELLAALDQAGIVTHIPFPGKPDEAPQLPAYREIMRRHRNDADWIAFIDGDEFLLPTGAETSMKPLFEEMERQPEVGAVAVNWACFGSNGHEKQSDDLVIERFSHRSEKDLILNCHYKSIVRSKAWLHTHGTPHLFMLKPGFRAVHPNQMQVEHHAVRGPSLSQEVIWDRLRLNHYVVKSRQEFFERKGPRGRATIVGGTKGEGYFRSHDKNEVADPIPQTLVTGTKLKIKELEQQLQGPLPFSGGASARKPTKGTLEAIRLEGKTASLIGWAVSENGDQVPFLTAVVGSHKVQNPHVERFSRSDLSNHGSVDIGFRIVFDLLDLPDAAFESDDIAILGGHSVECADFEIVAHHAVWPHEAASAARLGALEPVQVSRINLSRHVTQPPQLYVPQCNVGNLIFRYMTAYKIQKSVPGSEIFGFEIGPMNTIFDPSRKSTSKSPIVLKPRHEVDIEGIIYKLNNGINDGLVFNAYAQRLEYFYNNREIFQKQLASNENGYPTGEMDIVIAVRSGDIIDGLHPDYVPVPISYYRRILSETNFSPIFIGQLEKNWYTDALRSAFPKANFVSEKSWIHDFQTMRNATNIIISISSFSWLASWLSNTAKRIYVPVLGMLNPHQRGDINLLPRNDDRYVFDQFPVIKYKGSDYQKLLIRDGEVSSL